LSFDGGKECPTCANLKRYHIENNVEDHIRKHGENPIKLYSVLKKCFDDIVRQFPDFKILEKLHGGYIDSVQGILSEYKILKEKNESYEAMMNSNIRINFLEYNLLNKKYVEANKLLEYKNDEIRILKERLAESNQCSTPIIDSNNTQSNGRNSGAVSENNEKTLSKLNLYLDINKLVVEDLDSLYFFDKVHMKANSMMDVPKLDLNFDHKLKKKVNSINF
jgi:hypothetical protein